MDNTMGNQQETVSEYELGWLAGILDGEGSIGINRMMSHRTHPTLTPRISIGNTNPKIISNIRTIYKKIPVTYFLEKRCAKQGKNWKDAEIIQISHILGVKQLLAVITPYLIGKRINAEFLLKFVNSRISLHESLNRIPGAGGRGVPYSKEEVCLYEALKRINQKGIQTGSSTTTRQSPINRVKI